MRLWRRMDRDGNSFVTRSELDSPGAEKQGTGWPSPGVEKMGEKWWENGGNKMKNHEQMIKMDEV